MANWRIEREEIGWNRPARPRAGGGLAHLFAWWWLWLLVIIFILWFAGWGWSGYGGWWGWGARRHDVAPTVPHAANVTPFPWSA